MEGIFCYLVDMPSRVGATAIPNDDGTYTVYVNSRLSIERQRRAYLHEVRHIKNDDFYKDINIDEIEICAHKGD